MVEHVLAKDETGVRFSLAAHNALIVQWIGRKIPDLVIGVRILMGAPFDKLRVNKK